MPTPQLWSVVYDYIQWFFKVSHPFVTPDVEGDQSRPTHQDILEEEHATANHVINVDLSLYYGYWESWHRERWKFEEDTPKLVTIHAMTAEAHHASPDTRGRGGTKGSDIPSAWFFLCILIICIMVCILWTMYSLDRLCINDLKYMVY